jgi:FHA domain-containing protein/uncharacterized protein DUF1707
MASDWPTPVPERASAAEREEVARRLREGCESERLSLDTFSERVGRAFDARSRAHLAELVADLPESRARGRFLVAAVGHVSLWLRRVEAAWNEPKIPRLVLPVKDALTLGRDRRSGFVFSDPTVSRSHARLRHDQGTWWLADLGSANGTRLNGYLVADEVEVRPGDRVTLGMSSFKLVRNG